MKKRICTFLLSGLVLLSCALPIAAKARLPKPTRNFFVNDFADCLTQTDEESMQLLGEQLYKDTKAQVVLVTVPSLDGEPIEDYGYDLANAWGIGEEEADTGVLLLLSTGDRKVRIEVGRGLEGALPDGKTGAILDRYAMPYFQENDFSKGLEQAYRIVVNEVYTEFDMTPSGYEPIEETEESEESLSEIFVPLGIFALLIVLSILRRHGIFIMPMGGGGFFGGGFGGGSSSDGGGFSGGGGSFGGGGASRDF